jgi:hypothetical protein
VVAAVVPMTPRPHHDMGRCWCGKLHAEDRMVRLELSCGEEGPWTVDIPLEEGAGQGRVLVAPWGVHSLDIKVRLSPP